MRTADNAASTAQFITRLAGPSPHSRLNSAVANDVLELIGGTPLVRLNRVTRGLKANVYAKLEYSNPGGSVKDRIGLSMVLDAEARGLLRPGYTIIEPTSGNTGMGLALAAAVRGYKIIFTVPDKMSREKIDLLKAVGAKVRVTPTKVAPDDPRSHVELAKRIARETPRSFLPNQYENMANPRAHYETTGPEVWRQTKGKVDVLVASVGTGGTISGTGRYLKERNPCVKVVGADPAGSILAGTFRGLKSAPETYRVEGIGEDFIPKTLDMSIIDEFVTVTDKQAFETARRLAKEEGLLAGGSSGAAVYAALKVAKELGASSTVVVILPDTGRNYVNKFYDDDWMAEHGFLLREGPSVSVGSMMRVSHGQPPFPKPGDALPTALKLLEGTRASALPVVDRGTQVGSISALDLIKGMSPKGKGRPMKVEDIMEEPLPSVEVKSRVRDFASLLARRGSFAVTKGARVVAVMSAADVIRYLSGR
ncbi:MAG: cysteine synthase A [Thaumarchaeota archaeon]|nr:cysteine synthase A [Nitrososphaerota archaeon]